MVPSSLGPKVATISRSEKLRPASGVIAFWKAAMQSGSDGSVEIEQNGLEHVLKIPVILYCAKP